MKKGLGWMVREEGVNGLRGKNKEVEKVRKGLSWIVERGLGFVTVGVGKEKEVEKMRKGLSVIVGIAVLLFAYSASAGVVTNGLISWWDLDETNGTSAADSGPQSNTGTLLPSGFEPTWTTDTAGTESSGALFFDGVTNYVKVSNHATLRSFTERTVEFWMKVPEDTPKNGYLFHHRYWQNPYGWFAQISGAENKPIELVLKNTASVSKAYYFYYTADEWTHIAWTWDGATVAWYQNGNLLSTSLLSGQLSCNGDFYFGSREPGDGRWFNGTLDDVRIYDRALEPGEILQNYNAIPEPSTLLLLGGGLLGLLAFKRRNRRG